jgi:hypothetical protein
LPNPLARGIELVATFNLQLGFSSAFCCAVPAIAA